MATIAIVLFRFKNPQKDFINWVSIFAFLLIGLNPIIPAYFYDMAYPWLLLVSFVLTIGFLVVYGLRFIKKKSKKPIDYVKWVGVLLLVIYQNAFIFETGVLALVFDEASYSAVLFVTFPILALIYVYDRLFLNSNSMKKIHVIALIIQSVFIVLFLIYAFVQKLEADDSKIKAQASFQLAEKQAMLALENERRAIKLENDLILCRNEKK